MSNAGQHCPIEDLLFRPVRLVLAGHRRPSLSSCRILPLPVKSCPIPILQPRQPHLSQLFIDHWPALAQDGLTRLGHLGIHRRARELLHHYGSAPKCPLKKSKL